MDGESSIAIDKALFETIAGIDEPEVRNEFLKKACAGDATRFARVTGLMDARDSAEKFFRTAAIARVESINGEIVGLEGEPMLGRIGEAATVLTQERPGSWIGRYRLLERIGEGGCGVVYLAEQQEPVRRRVAMKII